MRSLEDSWDSIRPEVRKPSRGSGPTVRDGTNVGLGGAAAIVVVWILHDVLGMNVPPEVSSAFAVILGYALARLLRY